MEKIRKNSQLFHLLQVLSKDYFMNIKDFVKKEEQKAISEALNLGYVKVYGNGLIRLKFSGKQVLK